MSVRRLDLVRLRSLRTLEVVGRCRCLSTHSHSHSHDDGAHSQSHSHSLSAPEPPVSSPLNVPSKTSSDTKKAQFALSSAREFCDSLLDSSPPLFSPQLVLPFIPAPSRDAYTALAALSTTLRRSMHPPPTSSSLISHASGTSAATSRLRLQFWRQTLQDLLAGKPSPSEPVAVLLSDVVRDHGFTRGFFTRMVDARISRVGDPPFPDIPAIADFGENAHASMLYLMGESMPDGRAMPLEHVSSHIGRAMGVAEILSEFPTTLERRGRVLLPLDVMMRQGLREEDIIRRLDLQDPEIKRKLADAVFEVATHANDQLITARTMLEEVIERQGRRESIDDAMFAPILTAIPVRTWLEKLEKVDFDLFSPKLKIKSWNLPLKMYWAYRTRKI
ncbi:Squalene/phytoene synthase-domain-containing protein [Kockiozyma suomiensis]|uniref:Squalene/phytoene synthase-domain-containing protein n=1 Tax=Kockiozyma suomiensis TaxID=1337062 RepID=UPI00334327F7